MIMKSLVLRKLLHCKQNKTKEENTIGERLQNINEIAIHE